MHAMGRLVAKESTGTAVIGRTRGWTRSGLSSETLLADISAVRNCKVAERTVVWMIRWAMSIDKNLVTIVNRTLVSLDWSGVNCFTLRIGSGIWAAGTRRGRGCWTGGCRTRCWSRSDADSFGWDSGGSCCSGLFNTSRQRLRLVLVVGRATRVGRLIGGRGRFATVESLIRLEILNVGRSIREYW